MHSRLQVLKASIQRACPSCGGHLEDYGERLSQIVEDTSVNVLGQAHQQLEKVLSCVSDLVAGRLSVLIHADVNASSLSLHLSFLPLPTRLPTNLEASCLFSFPHHPWSSCTGTALLKNLSQSEGVRGVWEFLPRWPVAVFLLSAGVCMGLSATFHLLSSVSADVARRWQR